MAPLPAAGGAELTALDPTPAVWTPTGEPATAPGAFTATLPAPPPLAVPTAGDCSPAAAGCCEGLPGAALDTGADAS
jgi:hypothetical protein